MKDYSQNGEGAIIADYFGPRIGTLLDIGANDGVCLSNSRGLIEAGWSGVLVEPSPAAYRRLLLNNANAEFSGRVRCIQAAITTRDGPIDFYDSGTHLHKGDTSLLSTTRPEELARWRKSGEQFTKTTVRGITFRTLMRECGYGEGLPTLDLISIDAEGADYDILRQIDLRAVGCRMLCVETNGKENQKFIDYCAGHGMWLMGQVSENLIFCV
jgi:FkbM family methyltransferase